MKHLIKITEQDGKQAVSARELYQALGYDKSHWTRWYQKNIINNEFAIENSDYQTFAIMANGNETKDFALTIEFAKKLSMLARTEKGERVRDYFIKCEKAFKSRTAIDFNNPETVLQLAQNWANEKQRRQLAEKEAERLRPKAELMEKVLDADEKIDIGQAAKILGLPFGRNTLFKRLRERGVFFKNRNEPKHEYIKRGYFELREKWIDRNNHDGFVVIKVLVTQRGLEYISKLFSAQKQPKTLASMA